LYAIVLAWLEDLRVTIKTLGAGPSPEIQAVKLLGSDSALNWKRAASGLHVEFPPRKPCEYAYALAVTFAK
jgi:hypothetical protein